MINELIYSGLYTDNPYERISEVVCDHLLENGFFILLDIYQSDGDETNYNDLLRDQTRQFLSIKTGYRTIIPIPCGLEENCQKIRCITYKLFCSNHEQGRTFPASYRVISGRSFANKILQGINREPTDFTVTYTKKGARKKCYCTKNAPSNIVCDVNETIVDGYSI